jgi:L-alanine-DL-glutamate epimerase-like enolase superfamily enzyme
MVTEDVIASVSVATIQCQLPEPIVFGDWVMPHRETVVVRLRSTMGVDGWAFTLTRDGAVAEQIRKTIASIYVGQPGGDQERVFTLARRRSLASHADGIGLRALSVMDLAAWDLACRSADRSIASMLGGKNGPMPVTAIIGYPPMSVGPAEIIDQVEALRAAGWRRFKVAMSADRSVTAARLRAVRSVAPNDWLGLDGAWMFDLVDDAVDFAKSVEDVGLGWFEDVFPPGDAAVVAQLRRRAAIPIAMGDEQGGSYYPEALLAAEAVDVVRVDLTCMGGITGGRKLVEKCGEKSVFVAPHMNGHVHSQVFSALGLHEMPIEWGVPWTGVDPYADSLVQPSVGRNGLMEPFPEEPGFGCLVNPEWARSQPHQDPDGILEE